MFNGNVKIINASLTFLIKVLTQKARFNLYKKQISKTSFKSFLSALIFSFWMYIKHVFMLSISFQPHLVKHSALGHLEGTWRALGGYLDIRALKALGHAETQALGHSRHSETGALKALRHSGTWALFSRHYLADSI